MATQASNPDTYSNGGAPAAEGLNYRRLWLLCGVGVGGAIVSLTLFWLLWMQETRVAETQFKLDAEKKVEAVKEAMSKELSIMSLLKAFYAGSMGVDRREFQIFTNSIFTEHPNIRLMAWMPRLRPDDRGAYEEAAKKAGVERNEITEWRDKRFVPRQRPEKLPDGRQASYYPIEYVEPAGQYGGLVGFDIGSLAGYSRAIDLAEADMGPVMVYADLPGIDVPPGTRIYLIEVAHTEPPLPDSAGSPEPSDGIILGMFYLGDVVKSTLEALVPAGVDLYLYDVTESGKPRLILSWASRSGPGVLAESQSPPGEPAAEIHYSASINVAGRTWLAYCAPAEVYFEGKSRWAPWAALIAGLVITGLVVGYLYLLTGRTARIERLVARRTQELQASERRFRLLVENAADGFFLLDDTGRLLDVNRRASELLGYSREELLRMNVMDFEVGFKPEDHHELTWKRPASDFPINVDGVHRRKDGSTYPAEIRLNCLDTGGRRLIMAIARDVTERKQAEEMMRKQQRFLRHLIDLQERERKLVAYEIHDGLAQQLSGALMKLQSAEGAIESHDFQAARKVFDEVWDLIKEGAAEARRLIRGLRPPILDEAGIVAAVEYLCGDHRRNGEPQIEFVHDVQFRRLAAPLEVALFRIAQECLTNARRHSQSDKIRVELSQSGDRVRLAVQDWGVGFDLTAVKEERFGLRGIRERVQLLGGTAEINTAVGKGTNITVELPLAEGDIDEDEG